MTPAADHLEPGADLRTKVALDSEALWAPFAGVIGRFAQAFAARAPGAVAAPLMAHRECSGSMAVGPILMSRQQAI